MPDFAPSPLEETSTIPPAPVPDMATITQGGEAPSVPTPTGEYAPLVVRDPLATQGYTPSPLQAPLPQIPGYEILGELGRGGMGVVYKARQEKVNRLVALKMVLGSSIASTEARIRFMVEGEVLGRLQHPNIVQIYEVDTFEGQPFFALEFVEGGTLADLLKEKPVISPTEAAALIETLAHAVHYAHSNGVIHRDLKPANVLVMKNAEVRMPNAKAQSPAFIQHSAFGILKLTDFGLAKQTTVGTGLTVTGKVMGTPSYMAPEQAEGKGQLITPATDVYALGAILYELLAGRPPFVANTPYDVIVKVMNEEPPSVSSLRQKLPRDLATICHKCLQKEPAKRYAAAEELAADLRRFREDRPIHARPVGMWERTWRWCRRNPGLAGMATALFLLLVTVALVSSLSAVWLREALTTAEYHRGAATDMAKEARIERNEARRLLGLAATTEGLHAAADGDLFKALLLFAEPLVRDPENAEAAQAARLRIAAYRRLTTAPTLVHVLTQPGGIRRAEFSPDGRLLLLVSDHAQVWDLATGQPRTPPMAAKSSLQHAIFSPDGRWVATAAGNRTTRVWDAATGQPRTPPLTHQSGVWHVAFSPDGRWVVTASYDMSARVWDAATGQARTPPMVHDDDVRYATFSPDSRWVVTASRDGTARVWDAATGQPRSPPLRHSGVWCVAFSPDSRFIVTGGMDNTARVWDAATGQQRVLLAHERSVDHVSFSPDGRWILTHGVDMAVQVWDAVTGQLRTSPLVAQPWGKHALFSPDGRWIVTTSRDKTARVWDAATGQPRSPPLPHHATVSQAAFSPDGRRLVTASQDGTARVWDLARGSLPSLPHHRLVQHAEFSPDGRLILTACEDRIARVWDAVTGLLHTATLPHMGQMRQAAFSPDGRSFLTVALGVRVWDAATGLLRVPPLVPDTEVNHAAFSPDSRWIVTATLRYAHIWDAATGQLRPPPLPHPGRVNHVAFSPDSRWVVTAGDKFAQVWDVTTGQPRTPPLPHGRDVEHVVFSPDGRWVATASFDRTARVWDAATGQPRTPPLIHQGFVGHVAFSPDSRWVVTAEGRIWSWIPNADQAARVWDAATGEPRTPPLPHQDWVYHAAFSPDSRWVVTASQDGTARVWAAATGQPRTPPLKHTTVFVAHAAFSPDGRWIVTAGSDKAARLWELPPEDRPSEDVLRLYQLLAGHRIDISGGLTPLPPEQQYTLFTMLRAKYPDDFRVAPAVARQWRQEQIAECMKSGNLAGVFLHRDWMIVEAIREQGQPGK